MIADFPHASSFLPGIRKKSKLLQIESEQKWWRCEDVRHKLEEMEKFEEEELPALVNDVQGLETNNEPA
jgi:hypothetical protein